MAVTSVTVAELRGTPLTDGARAVPVDRNMSIINETLKVTEGDIVSSTCTPGPPESPGAAAVAAAEGGPRRPVSPRPRRADRSRMAAIHQLLQVNSQLSATLTTLLVSQSQSQPAERHTHHAAGESESDTQSESAI